MTIQITDYFAEISDCPYLSYQNKISFSIFHRSRPSCNESNNFSSNQTDFSANFKYDFFRTNLR